MQTENIETIENTDAAEVGVLDAPQETEIAEPVEVDAPIAQQETEIAEPVEIDAPITQQETIVETAPDAPEIQEKNSIFRNPQFWVAVCCGLMVLCIAIFVWVELKKITPPQTEETQATQQTEMTEATLPPPPANPIGLGDFELNGEYLTCTSTQSVLGIDVSEWQKQIDWQQVKDAGIEFAMVRVAWRGSEQGVLTEDTYARANLAGAAEAGIKVGAYIFSQAITPDEAVEEAKFLLDIVKDFSIEMPLVFDWEFIDADARTGKMDAQTLTACSQAFCNTVTLAGYQPMIYFNTNQSFEMLELRELVDYPFWLAQYDTVLNYPYKIDMWQYTETGTVPGISTFVDINLYFPWEE